MGRLNKYNIKVHDKDVKRMYSKGYFVEDFCAKYGIGKATYYRWINQHKTFRKAVEEGKVKGESKWTRMPLAYQKKNFSYPYWISIMKYKYGYGVNKIKGLVAGMSSDAIIDFVCKKMAEGAITEPQVEKLMSIVNAKIKATEINHEERIKNLEKYKEKYEHLRAKVEAMQAKENEINSKKN